MKKEPIFILTTVLFFFFLSPLQAQTWVWAENSISTGGGIGDEGFAVCADANGNSFVTGAFTSPFITFGPYSLANTGQQNFYIVKYDPNGNALWAKSAIGSGGDHGNSVATNSNGDVYVTGYFTSSTIVFGTYTLTNPGGANVFIVKYDPNGNVLWARNSIGTIDNEGESISIDATGNIYITGYFSGPTVAFGNYTVTNTGNSPNSNVFLVKYDPSGNALWAKSPNGTGTSMGLSVATDNVGNAYITGYYWNAPVVFGSYTLTDMGSVYDEKVFVTKYDANGNVLWAKGSSPGADAYSICTDASGNVYVTGAFGLPSITFGPFTAINTATISVFFAKYNSSGTEQWLKSFNGEGIGYSLSSDANNIYMSGSLPGYPTYSIVIDNYTVNVPPNSLDAMFVARFDFNGNVNYATGFTSGGDDQNAVSAGKNCNVFIAGDFQGNPSNMIIGTTTLNYTGVEDVFIAKLSIPRPTITAISSNSIICAGQSVTLNASGASSYTWSPGGVGSTIITAPTITITYTVTGTDTITRCNNSVFLTQSVTACDMVGELGNSAQLLIFPNPNCGSFKIQVDIEIENGELILINSIGQKVHEQKILRGENSINTHKLSSGIYHCIILENKQWVANGKIFIE